MQKHKVRGTLKLVGETRTFASGFSSRKILVDVSDNPNYPSPVEFQLKKEHVTDIDAYKPGDALELEFTLDGRAWEGPNGTKYFVDLSVWHVGPVGVVRTEAPAPAAAAAPAAAPAGGSNMDACVAAWKVHHGEDKAAFVELCKKTVPGKSSKAFTSDDWGNVLRVIAQIDLAAQPAASAADDFDDMPF